MIMRAKMMVGFCLALCGSAVAVAGTTVSSKLPRPDKTPPNMKLTSTGPGG